MVARLGEQVSDLRGKLDEKKSQLASRNEAIARLNDSAEQLTMQLRYSDR